MEIGERGFEPPTSASRTQRSIQAEPLPEKSETENIPNHPGNCKLYQSQLNFSLYPWVNNLKITSYEFIRGNLLP